MVRIRSSSRARPGGVTIMFGVFITLVTAFNGYLTWHERAKWSRLHEHGAEVVGVVSEKHVIAAHGTTNADGEPTGDRYHRVFFQPADELSSEQRELWASTSAATRYGSWVELFDDWDNRLWADLEELAYAGVDIGQRFELAIDGKESALFQPEGVSPRGIYVTIVFGVLAVALLFFGIRRRLRAA